jgi:hypothetical protein
MGFNFCSLIFEAFCVACALLAFVTAVQQFLATAGMTA